MIVLCLPFMKTTARVFALLSAYAALAFPALAQPEPKVAVVDLGKVYDGHYKTDAQNIKLRGDMQKAQQELERLNKEGSVLVEQYKEQLEQSKNPALTNDARVKAQKEVADRLEAIQRKQGERETFTTTVDQRSRDQVTAFRAELLGEIGKIASGVAQKKGATLLVDKSGPSLFGTPSIIYADPSYDITDEVMKEINKDRPAESAAPTATSPVVPANASPSITVPGAPAKK